MAKFRRFQYRSKLRKSNISVNLGAIFRTRNENIKKMERFCSKMTFKRPMDMEMGPDGCLYIIEWGTAWGKNQDTQIVRIEYDAGVQASISK